MPYFQSKHYRKTERLIYRWAAPCPAKMEAANVTADPLTGFPNLGELYRLGPAVIADCLSASVPCATAIVDIDHFRRVHDTYCEESVSRALKAIAARLNAAVSASRHIVARLDDEEFGLILVGLDLPAATDFCEKLRLEIAGMRISDGELDFSVTVSIGLAEVQGPETFDNYLNGAEQFLFMAKACGRNQVFSDGTIVPQATG